MNRTATLLADSSRVDAPFVRVTIGDQTFGVYQKKSGKITFPNLITSLNIKKINGLVNSYSLRMTYPITAEVDPNAIEKIISANTDSRRIVFDYGDSNQPAFVYRQEEAIITDIQTNVNVRDCTIDYTITAQSTAVKSLSTPFTLGGKSCKPSTEIADILNNNKYHLLDVYTGMRNKPLSDFIPTDDAIVNVPEYQGVSVMEYVSNLVACMSPSVYSLSTFDSAEGPYFKITKVESQSKVLSTIVSYNIDIGYPTAEVVMDFRLTNDSNWALFYNYTNETNVSNTLTRLDNSGNIYSLDGTLYKNMSYSMNETEKSWWRKVTEFPVTAELKLRGLLKPSMLMQYVKINVWFFGRKHTSSGYYIITGQTDTISMDSSYTTTLSLTRIAGEE